MANVLPANEALASDDSPDTDIRILFVDLDGSLVASNTLVESFLTAIRREPALALKAPGWLIKGRRYFKAKVADQSSLEVATLPYRNEVLTTLAELKAKGCRLVLATASHYRVAQQVADHLGIFDDVLATDENRNLKGRNKLAAIEQYCRDHGFQDFAYLGDTWADVPIWQQAAQALMVAPSARLHRRIARRHRSTKILHPRAAQWKLCLKALRPHQWMKNMLVFLPLVLAHDFRWADQWKWFCAFVAFAAFSACASSVYLVNDLLDLQADRLHPRKRNRPFASGRLPLEFGLVASPLLALFGIALSLFTADARFPIMLLLYIVSSALYCLWLKRVALVDVFLLSGLYILRVQAGGMASAVPVSEWLLVFSLFFFLSLAFAKRFVEVDRLELSADSGDTGRGYRAVDSASLSSLGTTSGYIAVLVLALYILSPDVRLLYHRPKVLCILCPIVLYWMSRLWMLARRNELHDDPVVFALKDRISQLLGLAAAATILLAWLLH
jgi:4-hydroxybenzoate polyprenyltransferase/phosphoserine phosphatase